MTPRVLILQHGDHIPPGYLGEVLDATGVETTTVHLHRGEPLPEPDGWDGVVILGGEMGAYDTDLHSWLVDEKTFIREVVGAQIPTLGLCLGSQLIADALGGRAYLAGSGREIGAVRVGLTPAAADDPVARHFDAPVAVWHQDTFDLPPGATLLASTDRYPQAFRVGSAIAFQPHPEASPGIVDDWIGNLGEDELEAEYGIEADELRSQVAATAGAQEQMARRLFAAWVEEVRRR